MKYLAWLLLAAPLMAQADYYPLAVGNIWIYKATGTRDGQALTVQVTQARQFGSQTYFLLSQSPGADNWVREDSSGKVWVYDPAAAMESLWYDFGAPEGQIYSTALPVCCGRAVVRSRKSPYKGLIGQYDNALEMGFPGTVQVGVSTELFLPSVGMVYRLVGTGGPSSAPYNLSYSKLGGVTTIAEPEVSTGVSLDAPVYGSDGVVAARLTLRNTTDTPVHLSFPSSQVYDLVIRNESGDEVWRWSSGKSFRDGVVERDFLGETDYAETVDLLAAGLAPGRYSLEAFLTPARGKYSATAGFEVQAPVSPYGTRPSRARQ